MENVSHHFSVLGFAMVIAFVAGKLAHRLRVPQVSAYLLVGVVLGPTVFNKMTLEIAENLSIINQLAFGLILFNIGGEFHKGLLKRVTRTHVKFSLLYSLIIFVIVTSICFLFSIFSDLGWGQKAAFSIFLGIVAIEAAPPTALLVIKEVDAKGPLTSSIMVFLAISTLVAIFGSQLGIVAFKAFGIWSIGFEGSLWQNLALSLWSLAGSMILGVGLGLLLSFWEQRESVESELLFAVLCALLLGQALAIEMRLEPLFVALFMGFALVNTSSQGQIIHARMKGMGLSLYALFFVLAGAHIHLQEQIQTVGILGVGYLIARTIGMIVGSKVACNFIGETPVIRRFLGFSVLSHAGAALAIVAKISGETDASAQAVIHVVLGSIFIFEIAGPLILRYTLVAAGEVKMGALLEAGGAATTSLSMVDLLQNSMENLGVIKRPNLPELKSIKLIVRRKVYAINAKASVKEVLNFVDKYHLPVYPVVDDAYKLVGTISISDLKDVIFDPFRARYSYASKLIGSRFSISEDATCEEAVSLFNESLLEVLPVIQEKTNKLVGTISYKDVVIAMRKS